MVWGVYDKYTKRKRAFVGMEMRGFDVNACERRTHLVGFASLGARRALSLARVARRERAARRGTPGVNEGTAHNIKELMDKTIDERFGKDDDLCAACRQAPDARRARRFHVGCARLTYVHPRPRAAGSSLAGLAMPRTRTSASRRCGRRRTRAPTLTTRRATSCIATTRC